MLLKIINTRGLKKLQDIFRKDNLESTGNDKIYYKNIKKIPEMLETAGN